MEVRIDGVKYVPAPDLPSDKTLLSALELRIDTDAGEVTIREYFRLLLSKLWLEVEGFSGKRPFGNSGWQYDVYTPLIEAGYIDGELDGDGYVNEMNIKAADEFVEKLITAAFYGVQE